MENKKIIQSLKGFTLVELIVVVAIIGVLSAVLIPGIVGYMRDSRISAANQNSQSVYLAVSSWHAKYIANNDDERDFVNQYTSIVNATAGTSAVNFTQIGSITVPNMRNKLSERFYGSATVYFNNKGDAVSYALWTAQSAAPTGAQLTTADQDAFANNNIVGCFPLDN